MVLQLNGNHGIIATTAGIDTHEMNGAFGEIAEDGAEYKRCMGDVARCNIVTDVDEGETGISAKYLCLDGSYVKIAFARIG